jgi:hypothetical protein
MFKKIKENLFTLLGGRIGRNSDMFDDPHHLWLPVSSASTAKQIEEVLYQNLDDIRFLSRQLFHFNEHYRGIINTYIKYIAGKEPVVETNHEQFNDLWRNYKINGVRWQKRRFFREWVRRFFRDGETFLYLPTMTFIDPALVQQPPDANANTLYGVEWNEYNHDVGFWVLDEASGKHNYISGDLMIHTDDTDDDQRRGLPPLLTIAKRADDYSKLLDTRTKLNEIRSSIALLRTHDRATGEGIKTFADAQKDPQLSNWYGTDKRIRAIIPGQVIDANSRTKYEFLAPNINATEVKDDIRSVRLCFSALTGLPEFMVAGDASNASYASTMVAEGPAEREFEDRQSFFAEEIAVIYQYITGGDLYPIVRFPAIVSRKTKDETDRNSILLANQVISLTEWRRREGVDNRQMEDEINGDFGNIPEKPEILKPQEKPDEENTKNRE